MWGTEFSRFVSPSGVEIYIGLPKPLQYRATRVCFMKKYNDYYSPADFKGDVTILKKTIKNPRDFSDVSKPMPVGIAQSAEPYKSDKDLASFIGSTRTDCTSRNQIFHPNASFNSF